MDFLNSAYKQGADLYESMTPAARITAGLLLGVVVIALYYLVQMPTSAPDELLLGQNNFSSSDLSAMEAALAQEGLNEYERVGNGLRIPRGKRAAYVAAIAKHKALPRDFSKIFEDQANASTPWESSQARLNRQKVAKQQELSLIISAMSGIERATVQYDEQEGRSFPRTLHKTAVVAVQPRGSQTMSDEQADNIIDFMIHAVAGLKAENITVTDLKANHSIVGGSSASIHGNAGDPYPARKLLWEREWTEKVRRLLVNVPGSAVSVNVELEPVLASREDTVKIDPKPVIIESNSEKKTVNGSANSGGGRPGVATNNTPGGANQPASVAGGATRSEQKEESSESQRNIPSHDRISIDKPALVPNRVSVAVTIPTAYYLQIHQQRRPPTAGQPVKPPDNQEMEALEKEVETRLSSTITPLLPKRAAGVDPYPQVVITRLPDLPTPAVVEPSSTEGALAWLASSWPMLGMFMLGGFGLVTLRGMFGGSPNPPSPAEAEDAPRPLRVVGGEDEHAAGGGHDGEEAAAATPAKRKRTFAAGGPDLREELVDLVKEDADAAAKILRNWIGDVA